MGYPAGFRALPGSAWKNSFSRKDGSQLPKPTGPRSAAGKSISRFNALKHGIYAVHQITFDDPPAELADLAAEYHELYSPANAHERLFVDTLVANEWRLRRMRRVEARALSERLQLLHS